jgi:PAS domain S-box-containing protein
MTPDEDSGHNQKPAGPRFDGADLLENVEDACYVLDSEWRFVFINSRAERLVHRTRDELLGKIVWDEFPEARGSGFDQQYRRSVIEGITTSVEEYYPPLDTWFDVRAFPYNGGVAVFFQDIDARKRAERKALERTRAILESITDAFCSLDADWNFTYINDHSEIILARSRDELLGKNLWEEYPEAIGTAFELNYRRAVEEHVTVTFEEFYPPLNVWLELRAYPTDDGLSVFYQDVTERKEAEEALTRSREDLQLAVDGARLGTFYCDWPLDKIIWNQTCKEHFFLPPDADVDIALFYSLLHPDDRERTRQAIERAQADRVDYDVEYRTMSPDGKSRWVNAVGRFYYGDDGSPVRFDGITIDISARKAAEDALKRRVERERFLSDLADRAQRMSDPEAVIADAVHSLGRFLGVSRCVFLDLDIDADLCVCHPDYRADNTVASIAGVFKISTYGDLIGADLAAGSTVTSRDVQNDPTIPVEKQPAYDEAGIRAHLSVPVLRSDQLVSCISVHNAVPRQWEPGEEQLLQSVAERTWLVVELLRQQNALAKGIEVERARAEREALLNRIGHALRSSNDPEHVLSTALREAGIAIHVDRSYYASYDKEADTSVVGTDWRRADLPTIAGTYRFSTFSVNRDSGFNAGRTQVINDAREDPAAEALGLKAILRVPLLSRKGMTAMAVAMVDAPRQWTNEEIDLLEAVATLTQSALESMHVRAHEHRIAQQLQDALLPALPTNIPGLTLGHRSQPALDEAQVGGDFYDVFALDTNHYAIVIGDVSGKGLRAAQQLALIRNTLRTTLYQLPEPAAAAEVANSIVTIHDLLDGFVTCWVGVYDRARGTIKYCCCGHEPPLLRRADGSIELLQTTGPPLGVSTNLGFSELEFVLNSGDALLLFTDGISEAGQTRRQQLGIEGLSRYFSLLPADIGSQAQADQLVETVRAHAGSFHDDVAVLIISRN